METNELLISKHALARFSERFKEVQGTEPKKGYEVLMRKFLKNAKKIKPDFYKSLRMTAKHGKNALYLKYNAFVFVVLPANEKGKKIVTTCYY
ncbi:MAG: hypothetical protein A2046_02620 [Bacteroidetes bacterium GWA2_30_7]|nr:MAG: hypothetical protein A2046_02620 [Bacteroidetes bacterium GWA2_30_7]